jgi:glycosyltransferase involved in cell wall biosynthesis
VSEDELAALYRGALFLVFPSFYEGFGLPIIEAFACGTPVITSNVTSMPEIAGDAALLVDPHDVDAIAEAMVRLASSPELRKTLVARGYERIGTFSWDAVAERVKAAVAAVDTNPEHPLHWS